MIIIKILQDIKKNVNLSEGISVIENILFLIRINNGISNKEIAKNVLLPIPVVCAVKNELKKLDFVFQESGVKLTKKGISYVDNVLNYKHFDIELYNNLIRDLNFFSSYLEDELIVLKKILDNRPSVDVTIDQSKCTPETSLKRAVLALSKNSLIGKKILCLGDDDFISISLALLTKRLFNSSTNNKSFITVLDIDNRILEYIEKLSLEYDLNISTFTYDARNIPDKPLINTFDCLFTDPPYTIAGLQLFLSRGITLLKNEDNLNVFFSFANKQPIVTLDMQKKISELGLVITEIHKYFNYYEGAKILGGYSQMICLITTKDYIPIIKTEFTDDLYTGEIKKTIRVYKCKNCNDTFDIGFSSNIKTIEKLKSIGCPSCQNNIFDLIKRK